MGKQILRKILALVLNINQKLRAEIKQIELPMKNVYLVPVKIAIVETTSTIYYVR